MAHAYKKTLLAQLGFADADKQNPKHDLAVEYLALPHNAKRLIQSRYKRVTWEELRSEEWTSGPIEDAPPTCIRWATAQLCNLKKPEREKPLTKGEDKYKATVGFLDLLFRYELHDLLHERDLSDPPGVVRQTHKRDHQQSEHKALVVEVKASPVSTGDLLRQMKLYREYSESIGVRWHDIHWCVAACFKFTEVQANALRQEGFSVATLGPLFDEWAEAKKNDRTLATNVVEF